MPLIRVRKGDFDIGKPLPWPLFDARQRLLFKRGFVPESVHQFNHLVEQGMYRDAGSEPEAAVSADHEGGGSAETAVQDIALAAIKLQIGDTLQLQSQADGGQVRHYVHLIGYIKGHSVLVTTPTREGKVLLMREGQNFVVRAFCGKHAYAFATTVNKVVNLPFPYLHLAYPASVRGLAVRRFARVEVDIIATVSKLGDEQAPPQAATIANLSLGGAMLNARAPLGRRGHQIVVKFRLRLNDIESCVVLPATIRAITRDEAAADAVVSHGIQFDEIGQQEQLLLTAFVYQHLLEETAGI